MIVGASKASRTVHAVDSNEPNTCFKANVAAKSPEVGFRGERTPDGSNVIREVLAPFAFGTERSAKQEVIAQQIANSLKVSGVPNAIVELLNKFRHAHANQPIRQSRSYLDLHTRRADLGYATNSQTQTCSEANRRPFSPQRFEQDFAPQCALSNSASGFLMNTRWKPCSWTRANSWYPSFV